MRLCTLSQLKQLEVLNGEPVEPSNLMCLDIFETTSKMSVKDLASTFGTTITVAPQVLSLASKAEILSKTIPLSVHQNLQNNAWNKKLTSLCLDNQNLFELPDFSDLVCLRWVSFKGNYLQSVKGLEWCLRLEEVCLEKNYLSDLSTLLNLNRLEHLNVSHNQLSSFSAAHLEKLLALKCLEVDFNFISSLNGLQVLTSLSELYAGDNKIDDINQIFHLKTLPNLTLLDLSDNSCLKSWDNCHLFIIYHLNELKNLNGIDVKQTERDQSIEYFGGLLTQQFIAEHSGLTDFSQLYILEMMWHCLTSVDLKPNNPFQALMRVNLDGNSLTSFGGLIWLPNLKILSLNHNCIECVVPKYPHDCITESPICYSLEVLLLGNNNIMDIPGLQLNKLKKLRALFLHCNRISKVEGLDNLCQLEELVLDRNRIRTLTHLCLSSQVHLKELHLQENRLKEIPLLSHLRELNVLNLTGNRIMDCSEIEKLVIYPLLTEVALLANQVSHFDGYRSVLIFRYPQLRIIDNVTITDEERNNAKIQDGNSSNPGIDDVAGSSGNVNSPFSTVKITNIRFHYKL